MARMKPGHVPLERALSKLGLASRTEAQSWIKAGRLAVNGLVVTNPLAPVVPEKIRITLDGALLTAATPTGMVLAFHKPRGCVTTTRDEKGRTTVFDVLQRSKFWTHSPAAVKTRRWLTVGRLDLATTGLLLFTDDSKLADWLTAPATGVPRRYIVTVRGLFTEEDSMKTLEGIRDQDDLLQARGCSILKASPRESHVEISLTEGKNREIRRIMETLGFPVTRLKRVAYGALVLGDLPVGEGREVPHQELLEAFPGISVLLSRNKLLSSGRRGCK